MLLYKEMEVTRIYTRYTNTNLDYQQSYNTQEKKQMFMQLTENEAKFRNYRIGDLYIYKAGINHGEVLDTLYCKIGLEEYLEFENTKLARNASVYHLFISALKGDFKIDTDKKLSLYTSHANHQFFINSWLYISSFSKDEWRAVYK